MGILVIGPYTAGLTGLPGMAEWPSGLYMASSPYRSERAESRRHPEAVNTHTHTTPEFRDSVVALPIVQPISSTLAPK